MPVRSLNSSVLKWPDAGVVDAAVRAWAATVAATHPDVARIGYFGSYARGDWGVGSDVDLVILVVDDDRPFERRATRFDSTGLPVPAETVVYTVEEWDEAKRHPGFVRTVADEIVWVQDERR